MLEVVRVTAGIVCEPTVQPLFTYETRSTFYKSSILSTLYFLGISESKSLVSHQLFNFWGISESQSLVSHQVFISGASVNVNMPGVRALQG